MNRMLCRSALWTGAMLITGALGAAEEAQPATEACEVRVMTFNIRYNNPLDGNNAWPHRKEAVAQIIQTHPISPACRRRC